MPEISVIMPCYNTNTNLLLACVDSILKQTFNDFELIIVDDGSSNDYKSIYELIEKKDPRIQVIYKNNGGASSARNYGLQYASGKYVIFSDSDDVLISYFFEEAYNVACKNDVDIVIGCNVYLQDYDKDREFRNLEDDDIVILSDDECKSLKPYMVGSKIHFENGLIYMGGGPWTRLIKRDLATSLSFDCKLILCEDILWNLQLIDRCQKICYVKRAWYVYNDLQDVSITKGYNPNIIQQTKDGLFKIKEYLNFNIDKEYKAYCERCLGYLSTIYRRYLGNKKCILSREEKQKIYKMLYTEEPWNTIADFRFFKITSIRGKIKWISYKVRLLFILYYIHDMLIFSKHK